MISYTDSGKKCCLGGGKSDGCKPFIKIVFVISENVFLTELISIISIP